MHTRIRVASGFFWTYVVVAIYVALKCNAINDADLLVNSKIGLIPFLDIPMTTRDFLWYGLFFSLVLFVATIEAFLSIRRKIPYTEFRAQGAVASQINWFSLFVIDSWMVPLSWESSKVAKLSMIIRKILSFILIYLPFNGLVTSSILEKIHGNESFYYEGPFYYLIIFGNSWLFISLGRLVLPKAKNVLSKVAIVSSTIIVCTYSAFSDYNALIKNTHQELRVCRKSNMKLTKALRASYCGKSLRPALAVFNKYFVYNHVSWKMRNGEAYFDRWTIGGPMDIRTPQLSYARITINRSLRENDLKTKFEQQMVGARIDNVDIHNAQMFHAFGRFIKISNSDLSGARGLDVDFSNSSFSSNRMAFVDFEDANFSDSSFFSQDLKYSNFSMTNMKHSQFEASTFEHDTFAFALLGGSTFLNVVLKADDFSYAKLENSVFLDAKISPGMFNSANMKCDIFANVDFLSSGDSSKIVIDAKSFSSTLDLREARFVGGNYTHFLALKSANLQNACKIGRVILPKSVDIPKCKIKVSKRCPAVKKLLLRAIRQST